MASKPLSGPSGWVKGLSMWPGLIPGDMLKTSLKPAYMLRPGMICVLHSESQEPFVHRIVRLRNLRDSFAVTTAGDNSGIDEPVNLLAKDETVMVVTGVLRRGRYRRPGGRFALQGFLPALTIRLWNRLVRSCLW